MDGSVSTGLAPRPPPDFKDQAKTRDRFPWNPGSLLDSLSLFLETEKGDEGEGEEEWSVGRRGFDRTVLAPSAGTVILRALFELVLVAVVFVVFVFGHF